MIKYDLNYPKKLRKQMITDQEIQEYYIEATKDARVNNQETEENKKPKRKLFFIFNLFFLLGIIAYFSYTYFQNKNIFLKKTSVLGVSYTSDNENQKLKAILDKIEADRINNDELNEVALNEIVNDSSPSSAYIESLNKEISQENLDDVSIVVHNGDTLRTLATRYYGDAQAYTKILNDNPIIGKHSNKIYAGQIIKLSY